MALEQSEGVRRDGLEAEKSDEEGRLYDKEGSIDSMFGSLHVDRGHGCRREDVAP